MRSRWGTVACSTGDNRGQPGTTGDRKTLKTTDILGHFIFSTEHQQKTGTDRKKREKNGMFTYESDRHKSLNLTDILRGVTQNGKSYRNLGQTARQTHTQIDMLRCVAHLKSNCTNSLFFKSSFTLQIK